MADKFHVNDFDQVGKCKAGKGNCPFGGETGDENHFTTHEEAEHHAEKRLSKRYALVNTLYKSKSANTSQGKDALGNMRTELKKRIISESTSGKSSLHPSVVGKVFSKDNDELVRRNVAEKVKSQKLLRTMSEDDSAKVREFVARRSNNPEVLKKLATDDDPKVRRQARLNSRMPKRTLKKLKAEESRKHHNTPSSNNDDPELASVSPISDNPKYSPTDDLETSNVSQVKESAPKFSKSDTPFTHDSEETYVVDSNGSLWTNITGYSDRTQGRVVLANQDNGEFRTKGFDQDDPKLQNFSEVKRNRTFLEHRKQELENSPARTNHGFPEDEMIRNHIESKIWEIDQELESLDKKS